MVHRIDKASHTKYQYACMTPYKYIQIYISEIRFISLHRIDKACHTKYKYAYLYSFIIIFRFSERTSFDK